MPSPPSDSTGDRDRPRGRSSGGPGEEGPGATVTASAQLPELDERALAALGEVGRGWAGCMPPREVWERALPVDRRLDFVDPQSSRAGRFVHIRSVGRGADDDELEATAAGGGGRLAVGPRGLRSCGGC